MADGLYALGCEWPGHHFRASDTLRLHVVNNQTVEEAAKALGYRYFTVKSGNQFLICPICLEEEGITDG